MSSRSTTLALLIAADVAEDGAEIALARIEGAAAGQYRECPHLAGIAFAEQDRKDADRA